MAGGIELLERWLRNLTTESAPVIDGAHLHIHDGEMYDGGWVFSGVADGAQSRMLMIPGDDPAHLVTQAVCGGRGIFHIYENPTVVASGTYVGGENLNRQVASAQPAGWLTYHSPTISDVGNSIHTGLIPGSAGANPVGARASGETRAGTERVLNTGTIYLFVVQNQAGATVPVEIELEWYEEELDYGPR